MTTLNDRMRDQQARDERALCGVQAHADLLKERDEAREALRVVRALIGTLRAGVKDMHWYAARDAMETAQRAIDAVLPNVAGAASVAPTERKCDECEGGSWFDGSHGCSRTCKKCKGTGVLTVLSSTVKVES